MVLYLAAVSNLRYNPQQMALHIRLRARQPSGKPGVIAVTRKLLVRCYSLWKKIVPTIRTTTRRFWLKKK